MPSFRWGLGLCVIGGCFVFSLASSMRVHCAILICVYMELFEVEDAIVEMGTWPLCD